MSGDSYYIRRATSEDSFRFPVDVTPDQIAEAIQKWRSAQAQGDHTEILVTIAFIPTQRDWEDADNEQWIDDEAN